MFWVKKDVGKIAIDGRDAKSLFSDNWDKTYGSIFFTTL